MVTFTIVNPRKSYILHHVRSLMLWKSTNAHFSNSKQTEILHFASFSFTYALKINHSSLRPRQSGRYRGQNRAKNLGLISGHPADPAGRLPPPRHMLPHLLTLTRAAVPGLTLIHPDCHLLGKNLCVDKIASRPGGILGVDKIVHFTVFSILY